MIDSAYDEWLTGGVLGRRFLAWIVDVMVLAVVLIALKIGFLTVGLLTLGLGLPLLGLLPLVPFAYVVGFVASDRGATPGQSVAGIMLRRNGDLGRPTPWQTLIWAVGLTVTMLAGAFWVLIALVTFRNRALHDYASGLLMTRAETVMPRTGIWSPPPGPGRPFA